MSKKMTLDEARAKVQAAISPKISNAPAPITPLTGRSSVSTTPRRKPLPAPPVIDWAYWKAMKTVKLWQACALVEEIDPDDMASPLGDDFYVGDFFPHAAITKRFKMVLRLAASAVSYTDGPIFPKGRPRPGAKEDKDVVLAEVVAFLMSCEAEIRIPQQLQALGQNFAASLPQEQVETKEQRQDRRLAACEAAGLTMDKKALLQLPYGVGDCAKAEGVSRQTFSDDVKAALKRRLEAKREGAGNYRA